MNFRRNSKNYLQTVLEQNQQQMQPKKEARNLIDIPLSCIIVLLLFCCGVHFCHFHSFFWYCYQKKDLYK